MPSARRPPHAATWALLALLPAACVTLDTSAPLLAGSAQADPTSTAGRHIYITTCAKCHSVEPVKNYSAAQWATIMPDMAQRSKLTPAQEHQVTTYVRRVLQSTQP